jgi:thioredoxin 1
MLGPTFERLADQYSEKVTFAKVNVDECPEIANKFSIRSIPTLILMQGGSVVETLVGLRSEQELTKVLDLHTEGNGSK